MLYVQHSSALFTFKLQYIISFPGLQEEWVPWAYHLYRQHAHVSVRVMTREAEVTAYWCHCVLMAGLRGCTKVASQPLGEATGVTFTAYSYISGGQSSTGTTVFSAE